MHNPVKDNHLESFVVIHMIPAIIFKVESIFNGVWLANIHKRIMLLNIGL